MSYEIKKEADRLADMSRHELVETIKSLEQRVAFLDTMDASLEIFTSNNEKTFDEVLSNGLRPFADTLDLDRIIVYQVIDIDMDKRLGQIYRWDKSAGGLSDLDEELIILPDHPAIKDWVAVLSRGDIVNVHTSIISGEATKLLNIYGVKSILLTPVFMNETLWGIVGFQDHINNRIFDDNSARFLNAAAQMCANAIIRNEKTQTTIKVLEELKRREELMNMLNKTAVTFLSQDRETFEEMMTAGVKFVTDVLGLDRISVWRNFMKPDGLHAAQIYRWDKQSGGTTTPTAGLNDLAYARLAPNLMSIFSGGEPINSPVSMMSETALVAVLKSFGVVSAFIMPVFINNAFWGFVLFEDRVNERYFDDDSTQMMRSAAFLCANTVILNDKTRSMEDAVDKLKHREIMLDAVNRATAYLLDTDTESFKNALYQSMGVMAEAVKIDRIYIWKNRTIEGRLYCNKLYEWSEGAEPQQGSELTIDIPYNENLPGWEETLSNGKCINNLVRNMSPEEQAQLSQHDVISILVVPVFVRDHFWGFVSFDNCHNERIFTDEEEAILRSSSLLIANALLRNEMIINIRDTSAQLKTALEEATAASKAKSDFLSTMSHEMRTPMNAIIGMTSIGKKADDLKKKDYAFNRIEDASSHLLGVINDVLDMAKIEADKLELAPIEYCFEKMLQKVVTVVNFRVKEKQQEFSLNVSGNVPRYIVGDDRRLAQIMTNLLSNAVKFTPEGGRINLEASLLGETDGICELQIEVADNGIGISPEQQKKLFQAFGQAESGTSRKYGGTGLGLVISKRIAELMGGRIWIESEIGKGSRFIFTIKVRRGKNSCSKTSTSGISWTNVQTSDFDDILETREQKDGAENTRDIFKGKKLLLAEDIAINREVFLALLENTELQIDCAENGQEALDMVKSVPGKYDIVFMDVQMPIMDGFEATQCIRALPSPQNARLPIIAMTANVFKDDIDACLAAGMDDHIGKPLDINTVLEKLHKYLKV